MTRFPSLEDQLDLITKGAAEIVPLEALKESREQKKPVIIWVFLGNPKDERC